MCQVETSESLEGIFPGDLINGSLYNWNIKLYGARQVVGEIGKEVFLRRTLACGTHYGIGMFCLTEAGEQQIDRSP